MPKKLITRTEIHISKEDYKCFISGRAIPKGEEYKLVYIKNFRSIKVKNYFDEDEILEACIEKVNNDKSDFKDMIY